MNAINTVWVILLFISVDIVVSLPATSNISNHEDRLKSLELVFILHRHGIRAPIYSSTWPSDPYRNQTKYWPAGWGELLQEGKRMLYRLGKTLKKRYEKFIQKYAIKALRIQSSDYSRCLMSVASLMAGWFPPEGNEIWVKDMPWQPIPIHTTPSKLDWIIDNEFPCDKRSAESRRVMNDYKKTETEDDRKLYAYLTKHMKVDVSEPKDIVGYYTTMMIEEVVGYTLPDWTKVVYPDIMKAKALSVVTATVSTPYLRKMSGGPMLQELLHKFNQKSQGENHQRKVLIYSGHDINIAGVWVALGLSPQEVFPAYFGTALVFELHKSNDNYFVKMFRYNDTAVTDPYEIQIPFCGTRCSLPMLFNITNYMRSADPVEDCVTADK